MHLCRSVIDAVIDCVIGYLIAVMERATRSFDSDEGRALELSVLFIFEDDGVFLSRIDGVESVPRGIGQIEGLRALTGCE